MWLSGQIPSAAESTLFSYVPARSSKKSKLLQPQKPVSVLVVNAVNSIETFTDDKFAAREDHGIVELILEGSVSDKTTLLLDSMILGLRDIQTQYGNEFIRLKIEEV